jgi:hypothetical protein
MCVDEEAVSSTDEDMPALIPEDDEAIPTRLDDESDVDSEPRDRDLLRYLLTSHMNFLVSDADSHSEVGDFTAHDDAAAGDGSIDAEMFVAFRDRESMSLEDYDPEPIAIPTESDI